MGTMDCDTIKSWVPLLTAREMATKIRTDLDAPITDQEWAKMTVLPEWAKFMGSSAYTTHKQTMQRSAIVLDLLACILYFNVTCIF